MKYENRIRFIFSTFQAANECNVYRLSTKAQNTPLLQLCVSTRMSELGQCSVNIHCFVYV